MMDLAGISLPSYLNHRNQIQRSPCLSKTRASTVMLVKPATMMQDGQLVLKIGDPDDLAEPMEYPPGISVGWHTISILRSQER